MSRLIHTKDILGIIFLFTQICIYFILEMEIPNNPVTILLMTFTLYLSTLTYVMNMLYINCVCVLKACFKSINDNLTHMQRLVVEDVKSCVPAFVCHTRKKQFLLKLNALKKWHLTISDTVQMLNLIFSLQLLAIIVMSFCNIAFKIYTHIVRWQDGILVSLNMRFLGVLLTSILYYIIKISLLLWACETSKNQAQKISTIVHDLLNSTNDKQIKYE
ncbi:PREDICTED: uncharacterized protein LOC105460606, partial [Wasmannia auropunctata]|uniref:uncharacterized protein LOC105460606 n=1 Tax=Wasmannia auropunctata TaxID=64793 RepID=UPI0005F0471F